MNYFAGQGTLQSHHSPTPLSSFADVPPLFGSPEQLRNPNPIALLPVWHPRSLIPVILLKKSMALSVPPAMFQGPTQGQHGQGNAVSGSQASMPAPRRTIESALMFAGSCLYTLATGRFKLGFKTRRTYISATSRKKEGENRRSRGWKK